MPALTAQQQLAAMVDSVTEPKLTADELTMLLSLCAVEDTNGLPPTNAGWTPTYDLNRGAAEGWRWKAARVATQFDFGTGARETYSRSQVHAMCLAQAKEYSKRIASTVIIPGAVSKSAGSLDPVTAS